MEEVKETARVRLMKSMPGTIPQISALAKVKPNFTKQLIKDLHLKGLIHISAYKRTTTGGRPVRIFAAGPGKDAVCKVKPLPINEKARNWRERRRRDGSWIDLMAKQNATRAIQKTVSSAHGSWLGPLLML